MPRVLNYHRDRLPAGAVYIGRKWRHLPASKWDNPFIEGRHGSRAEVIAKYRAWVSDQPDLVAALPELRGRDLVCWCAPQLATVTCCSGSPIPADAEPKVIPDAGGAADELPRQLGVAAGRELHSRAAVRAAPPRAELA